MDRQGKNSSRTDLALTMGTIAAKLFGVVNPVGATVGIVGECIRERRAKRLVSRLERLINSLENRVKQLEYKPEESNLDLLDEIVAKAISDEDEDKIEYYAALVQYHLSTHLDPYETRLLSNALKNLTVYEIKAFCEFGTNQIRQSILPKQLEDIRWNRVEYLGLFKGGTAKHSSSVTLLGKKFTEVYKLSMPVI